jgi:nicotinate (nicotinamide) nucleotide adenylyltransferase
LETGDFYNLTRLFYFREILDGLDPDSSPRAVIIHPSQHLGSGRVGILCGAFNPPTLAHVELARRAKEGFKLDHILFTMGRITVDKEKVEGISLEDRMLLLSLMVKELGWASVAAVNKGLYFEQAKAFRTLLGNKPRLFFAVGMDKVMQIFDPRYYQDRDTALKGLFTEVQLIAANRGPLGENELKAFLSRNENQVYEDRVHPLTLPEGLKDLTSTELRARIRRGESVQDQLPDVVERFVVASGIYRSVYEDRCRLVDHLYSVRAWAEKECDFEALVRISGEKTERGENLRGMLTSAKISSSLLKELLSNLVTSSCK